MLNITRRIRRVDGTAGVLADWLASGMPASWTAGGPEPLDRQTGAVGPIVSRPICTARRRPRGAGHRQERGRKAAPGAREAGAVQRVEKILTRLARDLSDSD